MRRKAQANSKPPTNPGEVVGLAGGENPVEGYSVGYVVANFTLLTIPDWNAALLQMKRVLKPGGELLFLEHGESPDDSTRKWQNRINPSWKKLAGGCHLNRHIADLIRHAGFELEELENLYIPKSPKIAGYIYKGMARKPVA